jgi:hypothetical protein
MKVKEAIALLLECNPDYDLAYEHCYVDYIRQSDKEKLVDMGDLRPFGYSKWIPLEKREPEDNELPCLIALKGPDEVWRYYMSDDLYLGIGTAAKMGGMWMPIDKTPEDKYRKLGYDEETIQKLLKAGNNGK